MKKAVIVIPTYNEEKNLKPLVAKINLVIARINNWQIEILFVDSQSPDNTQKTIKELQKKCANIHLLSTPKEGLGKAYYRGFNYAIELLNPYVIFEMDADLSHDPKEIPNFLKKIESGADFVIGSRYIKGGSIPSNWGLHRKVFSIVGNLVVRFGFMNLKISDWTDGYRAIKIWIIKSALPHIKNYSGYVFQIALLNTAVINKAVIKEIPVQFADRREGVSKINSVQYITQILLYVFTHSSFIKFIIVGFTGFFIDFGFAYFLINSLHTAKAPSNMLSAEFAIISNFFLNNFWSFRHKKISGGIIFYALKFISFNFVSLGAIIIQGAGIALTLWMFGDKTINFFRIISIQSWIIYKVLLIAFLVIPYSYILYNKVVWKEK